MTGAAYDLDATRQAGPDVVEGFLVAQGTAEVRPIVAGIGIFPVDLHAHLDVYGSVYGRTPLADSRVARFLLGRAGRRHVDFVPFDEVIERYGDLQKEGVLPEIPDMAAVDAALAALLAAHVEGGRRALDIGCGVGRGAFVLRGYVDRVLGLERSVARARRARNVASTDAAFFLPGPPDSGIREVPVDLGLLDREGVDFAVAAAERLPLADGCADVVVLRAGDGRGAWDEPEAALAEALRVASRDAVWILDRSFEPAGLRCLGEKAPFRAWAS